MKKMLVVTLILFATININAQTFSKKIYNDNGGSNFIETYDNNYAFHYKDSLTIFDNQGNILSQEKNYDNNCQPIDFFYLPNNSYLSIGMCDEIAGESYTLWFRKFDENFNTIFEKHELLDYTNSRRMYTYDCILNNKNEPIIIIDKIAENLASEDTTFLYHFSKDCELIFDTAYTDYLWMRQSKIEQIPDSTGYLLSPADWGLPNLLILDNKFAIVDTLQDQTYYSNYRNWWDIKFINDTTFILASNASYGPPYNTQIGIVKCNINGDSIKQAACASTTDNKFAMHNGLSFVDSSYIYTTYSVATTEYNSLDPTLIGVTKMDMDFNIIWEKFYGDSINKYDAFGIFATQDEGAIVIGGACDIMYSSLFHLILKIDSLGNNEEEFTGIDNTETNSIIKSHELIIYPNPGNKNMQVRTAVQQLGGVFYIYDITGKLVLQEDITSSLTQINTNDLLSGTYIYKYINNNKVVESGKWVKK